MSELVFHNTFTDKNLSLFQPKKDECDVCVAYKTGNCSAEDFKMCIHNGLAKLTVVSHVKCF